MFFLLLWHVSGWALVLRTAEKAGGQEAWLRAWTVGVDEPCSAAAAASHRPYAEDGLLCSRLAEWRGRLSYTLISLGEKSYFNPSVFNLLAVDFFFFFFFTLCSWRNHRGQASIKPQARDWGRGKLIFCNEFLRNTNIWVLAISTGK